MIFHDHVETIERVDTGRYDGYGNPIFENQRVKYRAEVQPLSTTETVTVGQQVETRYRLFLPANTTLNATGAVHWEGKTYEVQGDVEPHKVIGRLHHYEATIRRVSG